MSDNQRPEALAQFAESARRGERAGVQGLTATDATSPIPTDSKAKDDAAAKVLAEGATGEDHGSEEAIDRLPDRIQESQGKDNSPADIQNTEEDGGEPYDASRDPRTGRPPNPIEGQRLAREHELERLRLAETPGEVGEVYESDDEEDPETVDDDVGLETVDDDDAESEVGSEDTPARMASPSMTEEEREAIDDLVRNGITRERAEELVEIHGSNAETLKAAAWVGENSGRDTENSDD